MGFFFYKFTIFVILSMSMSSSLTRNVKWTNINTKRSARVTTKVAQCCASGGDYCKESKGRMFSVSVNLIRRLKLHKLHKHSVDDAQRVETRQKYNSPHCVGTMPICFFSTRWTTWSLSLEWHHLGLCHFDKKKFSKSKRNKQIHKNSPQANISNRST